MGDLRDLRLVYVPSVVANIRSLTGPPGSADVLAYQRGQDAVRLLPPGDLGSASGRRARPPAESAVVGRAAQVALLIEEVGLSTQLSEGGQRQEVARSV